MSVNLNGKHAWVLGCLAGSVLAIASAAAETTAGDANPYSIISDRNVFHLNPLPPPPVAVEKPPDLPIVKFSGITKVGDHMKAYLVVPGKDPKDTAYLALREGEKENDVEIVKIRADKGEVDILNTGTAMTLTLASNGLAVSGGAPAGRPGGGTPLQGFNHRMPGMPGIPPPNMPAAAAPAPTTSTTGSALVIGGSGDNGGASYSGGVTVSGGGSFASGGGASISGGSAFVSGGATPTFANTAAAGSPANNASAQIANALFSGTQPYHVPVQQNIIPAPLDNQKAALLIQAAAGGPPVPTSIINEAQGGDPQGGPPEPP